MADVNARFHHGQLGLSCSPDEVACLAVDCCMWFGVPVAGVCLFLPLFFRCMALVSWGKWVCSIQFCVLCLPPHAKAVHDAS